MYVPYTVVTFSTVTLLILVQCYLWLLMWCLECTEVNTAPQFLKIYIGYRVVFKTALMVWKCVYDVAPAYLSDLCVPVTTISGR